MNCCWSCVNPAARTCTTALWKGHIPAHKQLGSLSIPRAYTLNLSELRHFHFWLACTEVALEKENKPPPPKALPCDNWKQARGTASVPLSCANTLLSKLQEFTQTYLQLQKRFFLGQNRETPTTTKSRPVPLGDPSFEASTRAPFPGLRPI